MPIYIEFYRRFTPHSATRSFAQTRFPPPLRLHLPPTILRTNPSHFCLCVRWSSLIKAKRRAEKERVPCNIPKVYQVFPYNLMSDYVGNSRQPFWHMTMIRNPVDRVSLAFSWPFPTFFFFSWRIFPPLFSKASCLCFARLCFLRVAHLTTDPIARVETDATKKRADTYSVYTGEHKQGKTLWPLLHIRSDVSKGLFLSHSTWQRQWSSWL